MRATSVYQEKYDSEPEPIRRKPVIRKKKQVLPKVIKPKPIIRKKITKQEPEPKKVTKSAPIKSRRPYADIPRALDSIKHYTLVKINGRTMELPIPGDKAPRGKKWEHMHSTKGRTVHFKTDGKPLTKEEFVKLQKEEEKRKKKTPPKEPTNRKKGSSKGHTWLYGGEEQGYSMRHAGRGKWVTYTWFKGAIVRSDNFTTETEAREYIHDREKYYNGLKMDPSQEKFNSESDKRAEKKRRAQEKLEETHRGANIVETQLNIAVAKMPKKRGVGKNYPSRELKKEVKANPGKYKLEEFEAAQWTNAGQAHDVANKLNKRGYDTMVFNTGQGGNIHTVYIVTVNK